MAEEIHERFDLDRWKNIFPLNELRAQWKKSGIREPSGTDVIGPSDLAVIEQIREEAFAQRPDASLERIPTDVFVFGVGEPARRDVTKFGGLPYWPRSRPWPHTRQGASMQFAAQVCFADSRG